MSIDVSYDGLGFRLIEFLWQLGVASLTETKIAKATVIDTIITDGCADSANITDIVDVSYPLKIEAMSNGAAFFRARWNSASNTVKFLAYSAKGAT